MPITAVILKCEQQAVERVAEAIRSRADCEVRAVRESELVVVTDTATLDQDRSLVEQLEKLPGVVSAAVVFTSQEDILMEASEDDVREELA